MFASADVLEKVCKYLYYKTRYTNTSKDVPEVRFTVFSFFCDGVVQGGSGECVGVVDGIFLFFGDLMVGG